MCTKCGTYKATNANRRVLSILTHVRVSGSKLKRRSNLQIVVCSFVT